MSHTAASQWNDLLEQLEPRLLLSVAWHGHASHGTSPVVKHVAAPKAVIAADWAEPNDSRAAAYDLGAASGDKTWDSLSIHQRGDVDWFKFTTTGTGASGSYAKMTFTHALGDLDLLLTDSRGRTLGQSIGVTDVEQISLARLPAGTYFLRVIGYRGATNPTYALEINEPGATIAPDWAEANDTLDAARDLGSLEGAKTWTNLSVHQAADVDWFTFTTSQVGDATDQAAVRFTRAQGDMDIELYDSAGVLLSSGSAITGGESVSLTDRPAGTYYLRVLGVAGATNPQYTLSIEAPVTPVPPPPPPGPTSREWTVLVYMDADNDLESYGLADLNEMEAVTLPSAVTVAAMVDRSPGYDRTNGNWTDTRRGEIVHDSNTSVVSSTLTSVGEKNMGDPNTLKDFIAWGAATYPADHYALVLWDHGGGLSGVCWDDSSGGDNLRIRELSSAVSGAGQHFDVIGFDACLAGLYEQLYSLRNFTDVVVASEETEPVAGWDYTGALSQLAANPRMSAEQFGSAIVSTYGAYYGDRQTLSATRTSAYAALAGSLTTFSDVVTSGATATDWSRIISARNGTSYFTDNAYRDLKGFMNRVASSGVTAAIADAARAVASAVTAAVVANHSGAAFGGAGISINLPRASGSQYALSGYTSGEFDLLANTHWRTFLEGLTSRRG